MAAVRILTGLHGGEEAATLPRDQWPTLVSTRRTECLTNLHSDCRALVFYISDAAKNNWLGYGSREAYVRDGLGLDPDAVAMAVRGLIALVGTGEGDQKIRFDDAIVLGNRGGQEGNQNAKQHRDAERQNEGSNTTFDSDIGRGATYTLARLRRDAPALAARVDTGELSANAAAIEAGFRKKPVRLKVCPHCGKAL